VRAGIQRLCGFARGYVRRSGLCGSEGLDLAKEAGTIELAVLIHVLHELPDARAALAEIRTALAPEGRVLLIEPPGHVSAVEFERQIETASTVGLVEARRLSRRPHGVLLRRSG
jgi:hypothetical protein